MPVPYLTTKAAIQGMWPCADRWRVFCAAHPGLADDAPVTLESILDTNGESDCRWVLARMGQPGEIALRAFGSWCALQVLPIYEKQYPTDRRPRNAVEAVQAWCADPTPERAAARAAAEAAAGAARDAAGAARAARSAARAAAGDAAGATRDAAWAAWAARDAAEAAAGAAWDAAWAAAGDAAGDAALAAQLVALRHICRGAFAELDRMGNGGRA